MGECGCNYKVQRCCEHAHDLFVVLTQHDAISILGAWYGSDDIVDQKAAERAVRCVEDALTAARQRLRRE